MEEFREYIRRQRRQVHDQRTPPQDDQRKRADVETNERDEPLHRNHESGTSVEVQSSGS